MERKMMLKHIWGVAGELSIDSDELHMILARETNRDSMRAASDRELKRLLDALLLHKSAETGQRGSVTDKQYRYIKDLERKLGWSDKPERMRGFVKKYAKVDDVKWLTRKKAGTVIEGLKGLLSREQAKTGAEVVTEEAKATERSCQREDAAPCGQERGGADG